jgi:hypothetical protein
MAFQKNMIKLFHDSELKMAPQPLSSLFSHYDMGLTGSGPLPTENDHNPDGPEDLGLHLDVFKHCLTSYRRMGVLFIIIEVEMWLTSTWVPKNNALLPRSRRI